MRKFKFILILITLMLSFIPKTFANSILVFDGISYEYNPQSSDCTVVAGESPYKGDITIPGTLRFSGYIIDVKRVSASAFQNNTELTSITFLSKIIIDERAFQNCTNLTTVNFRGTTYTNYILDHAFENCINLKNLNISGAGAALGDYAFKGCINLKELICSGSFGLGDYSFQGCSALETVTIGQTRTIPVGAFNDCTSLKFENIYIPNVYEIYPAFKNSLIGDTITLNSKIKYRQKSKNTGGTFAGSGISAFEYGDMTEIPDSLFFDCDGLRDLKIPEQIDYLGKDCFAYCDNIENVIIEASDKLLNVDDKRIRENSFWQNSASSPLSYSNFTFPFNMTNVKNVTINRQLTGPLFHYSYFVDDEGSPIHNVNVTYGPEFKAIPSYFFYHRQLKELSIPESVTRIMWYAFAYNDLEEIFIPARINQIDNGAFNHNGAVKNLIFEQSDNPITMWIHNMEHSPSTIGATGPFINSEFDYVEFNRPCNVRATGNTYYTVSPFCKTRIKELKVIEGTKTYDLSLFLSAVIIYIDIAESIDELTMPTEVFNFGDYNSIYNLLVRNPIPPKFKGEGRFSSKINIYVPDSSVETYKSDAKWGRYNILPLSEFSTEAMNELWTGVDNIVDDDSNVVYSLNGGVVKSSGSDSETYEIYTLSGQMIYRGNDDYQLPAKGIYLLKSGRTTRKIVY